MNDHSPEFKVNPTDWRYIKITTLPPHRPVDLLQYPNRYPDSLSTGNNALAVLDGYQHIAEERKLAPLEIPEEETFCVDRTLYAERNYKDEWVWSMIPDRLDEKRSTERKQRVGQFSVNNELVSYVTGEGKMMLARATTQTINHLKGAGYKNYSYFVPLSNGEILAKDSEAALYLELFSILKKRDQLTGNDELSVDHYATAVGVDMKKDEGVNVSPTSGDVTHSDLEDMPGTAQVMADRQITAAMEDQENPSQALVLLHHEIDALKGKIAANQLKEV